MFQWCGKFDKVTDKGRWNSIAARRLYITTALAELATAGCAPTDDAAVVLARTGVGAAGRDFNGVAQRRDRNRRRAGIRPPVAESPITAVTPAAHLAGAPPRTAESIPHRELSRVGQALNLHRNMSCILIPGAQRSSSILTPAEYARAGERARV